MCCVLICGVLVGVSCLDAQLVWLLVVQVALCHSDSGDPFSNVLRLGVLLGMPSLFFCLGVLLGMSGLLSWGALLRMPICSLACWWVGWCSAIRSGGIYSPLFLGFAAEIG